MRECRPSVVFGEQVSSASGLEWFACVRGSLENLGYACGAADLPAASVGAPHTRQRLWWCAMVDSHECGWREHRSVGGQSEQIFRGVERSSISNELVNTKIKRFKRREGKPNPPARRQRVQSRTERPGDPSELAVSEEQRSERAESSESGVRSSVTGCGCDDAMGHTQKQSRREYQECEGKQESDGRSGFWDNVEWRECEKGKYRPIPIEPSLFPVVDGLPVSMDGHGSIGRRGALMGSGNAIVPQVAAIFVSICFEYFENNLQN
ncbi:MAG: hypothetical protein OXD01_07250 [Gammaproteobacteria bacterium]|nr:hypothetical protein [Gammaproteobacteria bacterium]